MSILSQAIQKLSIPEAQWMSFRHKFLLALLLSALFLLTSMRVHRYSIQDWNRFVAIENSETIAGHVRGIRSDDSFVSLPSSLSQLATKPPFSCQNRLIGRMMSMQIWYRSLCLDRMGWIAALLKPQTWGYLLGADYGIAWQWWVVELGLFYSCFLFVFLQSGRLFFPSLFASLGFLFSPFQQFWSLNQAEIFIFGFLMAIMIHLCFQGPRRFLYFIIPGFAYCLASFILSLYPPTQIQIGFFLLAFAASACAYSKQRWQGIMILALGTLSAVALSGTVLYSAKEDFLAMLHSAYPGQRLSLGGGMHWADWIRAGFLPTRSIHDWKILGNVCEAAGFVMIWPWLLPRICVEKNLLRQISVLLCLSAFILGNFWMVYGVSESFARFTLLSFVPSNKGVVLFGMFDLWLLSLCLRELKEWDQKKPLGLKPFILAFMALVSIIGACWHLNVIAGIPFQRFFVYGALAIVGFYLSFKRPLLLAPLLFLWSASLSFHFNPIAQGGANALIEAPLSVDLKKIHEQNPDSRWAFENSDQVIGNLPRIIGIENIGATLIYPQLELWKAFDPSGEFTTTYNRYASVSFRFQADVPTLFENPRPDALVVTIDPRHKAFAAHSVRLFAVYTDSKANEAFQNASFRMIYDAHRLKIYQRL